ncbi:MetQ/NlpA family ABC transporter substrate-binding protein [Sporomusa acidovorans]|uniref:Lipoprotein n=1 Tax=Sporomusa acidovorans (strain ATCC 49682 / DSM 3132 / Mol) TaxID=1123286 RepID=A0ABZ3IW28_SPOA4|nr:MetQ/NlpA family ABC transporter substrate-binding protein [Sporomusa acidovorans]OZC15291.1 D-methionine-binding lipoprotein MetQ precursor [Sporomusa acidovorans DSM 3132]SDE92191.1 D-methionine transport system substrate-binding protein [Sporomusa acidovorans]
MRYAKWYAVILVLAVAAFSLVGCGKQAASPAAANKPLKVGVTAGPHAEIMDAVKKAAEKNGLTIQVVEFNDYVQPNVALSQGDIDANSFQHQPYLDNMVKDRQYDIVSVAKTVIFPMGIYSKKVKSLNELSPGATIAIPNDPTNGGRALLLLEKQGLIKLKPGVGLKAAAADIAENPRNFKIKELDAAQVPRSLEDVDLAAINTNYAMTAGLVPNKDSLAIEDGDSPYANIIAVRAKDKDNPAVAKLIKIYQSDEIKNFVSEHFKGSVAVAW